MMMNVGKGWRQQFRRRLVRRWLAHGRRLCSENGMVTTELALTFPAVIMIVVALALTGAAGMAGVQVNAAARAACRSVAIGEDSAAAVAAGNRLLGGSRRLGWFGEREHHWQGRAVQRYQENARDARNARYECKSPGGDSS